MRRFIYHTLRTPMGNSVNSTTLGAALAKQFRLLTQRGKRGPKRKLIALPVKSCSVPLRQMPLTRKHIWKVR
jgi:hypothetical protein